MTLNDLDAAAVPYPAASTSESEPPGFLVQPGGSAAIAYHESAHALIARYYGLPVASATIVPGRWHAGRVLAPGADPDADPDAQIAAVKAICDQASSLQPRPGEDPENYAVWAIHAHSRCVELTAGHEGERLRDPRAEFLSWETDLALAKLYAETICAPSAVASYLHFAATEARAILQEFRPVLDALAVALEAQGTLDGITVDQIIATAVSDVTLREEKARRARRKQAEKRAAVFLKEAR
jgi:hypothetical protein